MIRFRRPPTLHDYRQEALYVAAGLEREGVPRVEARRRAWSLVRRGYSLHRRRIA